MTESASHSFSLRNVPALGQFLFGPRWVGLGLLLAVLVPLGILVIEPGRVWGALMGFDLLAKACLALFLLLSLIGIFRAKAAIYLPAMGLAFMLAFLLFGQRWFSLFFLVVSPALVMRLARPRREGPRHGKSQWMLLSERFLRSTLAQMGLFGVMFFYLITFFGPFLWPVDPLLQVDAGNLKLMGPGTHGFLFGSDQFSRDILSRLIAGAWISMTIGLFAVGLSISMGFFFGLLAGFFGGWVDFVVMRLVDLLLGIPRLVLLLVVVAFFKDSVPSEYRMHLIVVILGLTGWMGTSRLVRGEVLTTKERDFVQAGRALGFSNFRLMFKHIAPNCMAPVIVSAALGIGGTILVEAALSFLGLGVPPPTPSWGSMVADGKEYLTKAWWISTLSGFTIVAAVVSFNLLGDGIRDALDPRLASKRLNRKQILAAMRRSEQKEGLERQAQRMGGSPKGLQEGV
ncbi:MAG TPA: ABC transporter permease [Planctomycetes bacterium]|nr:ABC transporter permease [Planctomycetota bacterium]